MDSRATLGLVSRTNSSLLCIPVRTASSSSFQPPTFIYAHFPFSHLLIQSTQLPLSRIEVAGLSSWLERTANNRKVAGSTPAGIKQSIISENL